MFEEPYKIECSGCGVCAAVCPVGAIEMKADEEGFAYPLLKRTLCIDCKACEHVCAFSRDTERKFPKEVYAVRHRSSKVLRESTSGGMFTALSDRVLADGGVVYGAVFDDHFVVRHARAQNSEERDAMRGSKYVQSATDGIWESVRMDLQDRKAVLFTGTPCQVGALKSYLNGVDTRSLLLCDLVCHGVTSPRIWADYRRFLEKINHAPLVKYQFRPKDWGWRVHNELAEFGNGKKYHSNAYSNLYRELYYLRAITRPSCDHCPYASSQRISDITIADCRGIDKVLPDFECDDGVSLVLCNTQKGVEAFRASSDSIVNKCISLSDVLQPPLVCAANPSNDQEIFWLAYHDKGFKFAAKQVMGKAYYVKYEIKKRILRSV